MRHALIVALVMLALCALLYALAYAVQTDHPVISKGVCVANCGER